MPGDELMRSGFENEGRILDERVEREFHQLPSGKFKEIPRLHFKVTEQGGHVRKSKDVIGSTVFECGHARLLPDQENLLAGRSGQRHGYCQRCAKENCPKCLGRECKLCDEFHFSCRRCGRTSCKLCLRLDQEIRDEMKICRAVCVDCGGIEQTKHVEKESPPPQKFTPLKLSTTYEYKPLTDEIFPPLPHLKEIDESEFIETPNSSSNYYLSQPPPYLTPLAEGPKDKLEEWFKRNATLCFILFVAAMLILMVAYANHLSSPEYFEKIKKPSVNHP